MVLAGPPESTVEVPEAVSRIIDARPYEVVWLNGLGGLTFRIGEGSDCVYVKWAPVSSGIDLDAERQRLEWAITYTPVPRILGADADALGSWMISESLGAEHAVAQRWLQDPKTACTAVGKGLRALHDALPVESCTFEWSVDQRRRALEERLQEGELGEPEWGDGFDGPDLATALTELRVVPGEDLVVCHGDACVPNTLIDVNGEWVAHVDLGRLGVGDRWADLAVATWSTVWNYGPGWETSLYESYGVAANEEKIRYYRILWGLE